MRNDYDWNEVEWILANAVRRVTEQDRQLLEFEASERAFVHRLAVYLEATFWGWHVDCEYNRQDGGANPKMLKIEDKDKRAFPDIIVNLRGPCGMRDYGTICWPSK